MSDELIVKHCSPTLAGMKTGSLFSCAFTNKDEMRNDIRRLNRLLVKKGLRILPLRFRDNQGLIYIYRPSRLRCDLKHETACGLLQKRGYCSETPERCLIHLIKRLEECEEFPHEIGLFLGYPPEDVCGFIDQKAEGCKCVGYWKVYGDAIKARRLFEKYRRCTDVYCTLLANGMSIERLTVAG